MKERGSAASIVIYSAIIASSNRLATTPCDQPEQPALFTSVAQPNTTKSDATASYNCHACQYNNKKASMINEIQKVALQDRIGTERKRDVEKEEGEEGETEEWERE